MSKSRLMAARQCERRLWLEVHRPELARLPASTQAAFATGHEVGAVARKLYEESHGPGHLLEYDGGLGQALEATRRLLADRNDQSPVFEATFQHRGILVRLDVLLREPRGIHLVEVKSSTSLKPEHLADCAIQAWVARGAGLEFSRLSLAHIDNGFVYPGGGNYRGLLVLRDITREVLELQSEVPRWLAAAEAAAGAREQPAVRPGKRCVAPYECPFMGHCWPADAEYPVQCLGGDRERLGALLAAGYRDLRDVPAGELTRADHRRIQAVTQSGRPRLDPEAREFVRRLGWPRYFLDFETAAAAVPVIAGTRPYEPVPFQFSCLVEQADGRTEPRDFLDLDGADPARGCAVALLAATAGDGPVVVYTGYEQRVIQGLAARFTDLEPALRSLVHRLVDLHPPTHRYFYAPALRGSWSLKSLLPVVAPDLSYASGEIQEGTAASAAYLEAVDPATEPARRAALAAELTRYCALDTQALRRIARFFQGAGG